MAKLVFGMNQSLDGYVDHTAFAPGPALFRHFIEEAQGQAGSVYGRVCTRSCVIGTTSIPNGMRRTRLRGGVAEQPKWVVSRTLQSVGPNATLVALISRARFAQLKAKRDGEIEVAGRTWREA